MLTPRKVGVNSTLPVTISSITILNARNTRRSFLDRIFNPLLSVNENSFYTFAEALNAVSANAAKLERLGTEGGSNLARSC